MNYHDIKHDDMNNGPGLRVTLFVSGCDHHCKECQNPETWSTESGIPFDKEAKDEIFEQLDKDYISGITFSGGDPLNKNNRAEVFTLIHQIRNKYGSTKSIWIYTGYTSVLTYKSFMRKCLIASIISSVVLVITPSEKTIYTMAVVNEITPNNIQEVSKTGKDIVDYITNQIDKVVNKDDEKEK